MKKIAIGADHAGFELKEQVKRYLIDKGYEVKDFGTDSSDSSDYPDFAHPVAVEVESQKSEEGILICGSANGVAITANKHAGIRCAICWQEEIASLAKLHNNANVVALPSRYLTEEQAYQIVETFLNTEFEGGRHARRVNKISIC